MIRKLRRQRETVVPEDVMDKAMLNSLADGICTIELMLSEDGRVNDLRYTRVNKAFKEYPYLRWYSGRTRSTKVGIYCHACARNTSPVNATTAIYRDCKK